MASESDTEIHILSLIESSSDAVVVLSSVSEYLRPFPALLICREEDRAQTVRSIAKQFLPFLTKSVSLLQKRLSVTNPSHESPKDLFRVYDFCLECCELIAVDPHAVQLQRLGMIHCYQNCGWFNEAYNDAFRVLEQLRGGSESVQFLPNPEFGDAKLARLLVEVVVSIFRSVAMSRDMDKPQYLRILWLLREIYPWLRFLDIIEQEKFLTLLMTDMGECALSIIRDAKRFDEGLVHSFCISTLEKYYLPPLPKCHFYKFSRQVLSSLFVSKEIETSQAVKIVMSVLRTVACVFKVEPEENWLELVDLVSYCAHKSRLAGYIWCARVSKQLSKIAAVLSEDIPQANVILRLYSAGLSVNLYDVKFREKGKETAVNWGLQALLGDKDMFLQFCYGLRVLPRWMPDKECSGTDFDKILLNAAMTAFIISTRAQRKVEITARLIEDVIATPWISTLELKFLYASFHDIGVAFHSIKHLKEASMAFKLCIKTVWTCVRLLCQIFVNESKSSEDCLPGEAIIDFVSEACSKSAFYLDVLQQHGAQEVEKLVVFILESWSAAEDLLRTLPDPMPIIKQLIQIQPRGHESLDLAGSCTPLYLLLSSSQKILERVTRKILEQELLAYEEILPLHSELGRVKQTKTTDILLKDVFITKDLLVERGRILIWKARTIRASGTEHLKECIHYLSEAISISGNIFNESTNHGNLCCHQLAVAYCLRALCVHETEPDSKQVFQDLNTSLNLWLRIQTPCDSNDTIPLENMIPLLCNVIDLLSIKGWIELHHHVYELLSRLFKWKNVKLEVCLAMLWDCRRLSHALCPSPINDAVIMGLSGYFGEKSESTDFWIRSCLQFSKAKSIGFQLSLQCSPYEALHTVNKLEEPHKSDITIDDINNTASVLVSSNPAPSPSSFVAASLYYDLCERQLSCGNLYEALSYAKEAHRIRNLIFEDKFSCVVEKHFEKHNRAGKVIELPTYIISKFEVSSSRAIDVWPCGKFIWDTSRCSLSPWNVLQCYLESILQVGVINELIGEGVEAECFLSRGKAIACMQSLQPFVVAFSLALGDLYKRMQSLDLAAKELQNVHQRRLACTVLDSLGKCLTKSGKVHQAHEAILCSIAVLFNSNVSSLSSISPSQLLDFIGKEIKGDEFGVDQARILYNLCKLSLQTYHSRASRSICCDLSHIPPQKLVSWLTLAFVLSREVPILNQKISRLLAALYLLSSSSAEFSFSCDGELSASHWVTYYHQASLGAHINYQFLSNFSRRYKSGRNSNKEASRLSCMASAEYDFLRLAPESTNDIVQFAKNFFNSLSESTVICISVLGGTLSKLLQEIMQSPPVCAWLLLSRLSSKSQPVAILLPIDSVLEDGSDDDSNPSNTEVNGIKEIDKRWVCPWGSTVVDTVAPAFQLIMEENFITGSEVPVEDANLRRKKIKQLNVRLAKFLRKLEDFWLGPWRHLLLGELSNSKLHESTQKKLVTELRSKCKMEVNETLLKVFLGNGTNGFEGEAWISQLCLKNGCYIGRSDHIDEEDGCAIPTSASHGPQSRYGLALQLIREAEIKLKQQENNEKREPIILVLDHEIQMLPWENIPILRRQEVYRMPSVGSISAVLKKCCSQEDTAARFISPFPLIDPQDAYYLLNPSGDLRSAKIEFESWFKEHKMKGRAGSLPATEELINALGKHDLFLYIGHGTGEQYIPMCRVKNLDKCAAAVLMGCSSGLPYIRGRYVPNSVPMSFLLAGSPVVVANLWGVTDDINQFGKAMLEGWFRERSDDDTSERVGSSMVYSRDACILQFLTGAAPVCYGVPTAITKTKKKT
ncbi:hypothetical protein AALP_AA6G177700 [Arabis alpina]|uniref:separase n=1 Tax=Arabis alpina TaxID=50452 RepID=A0A087GPX9_ARAAL|nr:hypothetical protein AALP_AA6G177700 [Arabis alpina]